MFSGVNDNNTDIVSKDKPVVSFVLNNELVQTDLPGGMVTLDFLRTRKRMTGTKEGCREGDCGACTVLLGKLHGNTVEYTAQPSCMLPLAELANGHLVTVEGLSSSEKLNPVQQALVDEGAIQCGFCTPGIVLAITGCFLGCGLLDEEDVMTSIEGNLCRCTGYVSIKRAALSVVNEFRKSVLNAKDRVSALIEADILPTFFANIPDMLKSCSSDNRPADTDIIQGNAVLIGGGTDLYVQRGDELENVPVRLLSQEPVLAGIKEENGFLSIGAATTVSEMCGCDLVEEVIPGVSSFAGLISSQLIRQRATLGGNIVNASPIGDLSIILLAASAELCLRSGNGESRVVPLNEFFRGYKQLDLRDGEIIEQIKIPLGRKEYQFNFEKVARRKYLDIASVNTAISLKCEGKTILDAAISAGGVGPIPMFLRKTAAYMKRKTISEKTALGAAEIADTEISPISDVRGSDTYKRLLLRQLILAHFTELRAKSKELRAKS